MPTDLPNAPMKPRISVTKTVEQARREGPLGAFIFIATVVVSLCALVAVAAVTALAVLLSTVASAIGIVPAQAGWRRPEASESAR